MTKQSTRPNQQVGMLKAMLLTGSVIATLAGTRLLAQQDLATAVPDTTESTTIVLPANNNAALPLPPNQRRVQLNLEPIPQVVQPQIRPVARSRSSR